MAKKNKKSSSFLVENGVMQTSLIQLWLSLERLSLVKQNQAKIADNFVSKTKVLELM